ncbi:MAG: TMEM165/GDT1 family protein [Candidatus Omnitrophota bacterium]
MDWKIFFTTFGAIFFAELADKTQLVGITMSAETGKPLIVWLGSVCAYAAVTLVSVLIGTGLAAYIKPEIIKYTAAVIFIIIGGLMFSGKI